MRKLIVPFVMLIILIAVMSFAPKENIPSTYAVEVDTVELAGYEFKIPDEATDVVVRENLEHLTWHYAGYFFGLSIESSVHDEGIQMYDTHLPTDFNETQKYYTMNLNEKEAIKMLVVREGETDISVDSYVRKFLGMIEKSRESE